MNKIKKVKAIASEYLIRRLGDGLGTGAIKQISKTDLWIVQITARLSRTNHRVVGCLVIDGNKFKILSAPIAQETMEYIGNLLSVDKSRS